MFSLASGHLSRILKWGRLIASLWRIEFYIRGNLSTCEEKFRILFKFVCERVEDVEVYIPGGFVGSYLLHIGIKGCMGLI